MHIVIFGLTISSSWGNGHATLWRSLVKAMLARGHTLSFYERDVPYYRQQRDLHELPLGARLCLYESLEDIRAAAAQDLNRADLALSTSFCPDGPAACELILESRAVVKAFYDLDTPVTLQALSAHGAVPYLPKGGLGDIRPGPQLHRGPRAGRAASPASTHASPSHSTAPSTHGTTAPSRRAKTSAPAFPTLAPTPPTASPRSSASSSNPHRCCLKPASSSAEPSTRKLFPGATTSPF